MEHRPSIKLKISYAWWAEWYVTGVYLCAIFTHSEPDWAKVERVLMKAIRIKVV